MQKKVTKNIDEGLNLVKSPTVTKEKIEIAFQRYVDSYANVELVWTGEGNPVLMVYTFADGEFQDDMIYRFSWVEDIKWGLLVEVTRYIGEEDEYGERDVEMLYTDYMKFTDTKDLVKNIDDEIDRVGAVILKALINEGLNLPRRTTYKIDGQEVLPSTDVNGDINPKFEAFIAEAEKFMNDHAEDLQPESRGFIGRGQEVIYSDKPKSDPNRVIAKAYGEVYFNNFENLGALLVYDYPEKPEWKEEIYLAFKEIVERHKFGIDVFNTGVYLFGADLYVTELNEGLNLVKKPVAQLENAQVGDSLRCIRWFSDEERDEWDLMDCFTVGKLYRIDSLLRDPSGITAIYVIDDDDEDHRIPMDSHWAGDYETSDLFQLVPLNYKSYLSTTKINEGLNLQKKIKWVNQIGTREGLRWVIDFGAFYRYINEFPGMKVWNCDLYNHTDESTGEQGYELKKCEMDIKKVSVDSEVSDRDFMGTFKTFYDKIKSLGCFDDIDYSYTIGPMSTNRKVHVNFYFVSEPPVIEMQYSLSEGLNLVKRNNIYQAKPGDILYCKAYYSDEEIKKMNFQHRLFTPGQEYVVTDVTPEGKIQIAANDGDECIFPVNWTYLGYTVNDFFSFIKPIKEGLNLQKVQLTPDEKIIKSFLSEFDVYRFKIFPNRDIYAKDKEFKISVLDTGEAFVWVDFMMDLKNELNLFDDEILEAVRKVLNIGYHGAVTKCVMDGGTDIDFDAVMDIERNYEENLSEGLNLPKKYTDPIEMVRIHNADIPTEIFHVPRNIMYKLADDNYIWYDGIKWNTATSWADLIQIGAGYDLNEGLNLIKKTAPTFGDIENAFDSFSNEHDGYGAEIWERVVPHTIILNIGSPYPTHDAFVLQVRWHKETPNHLYYDVEIWNDNEDEYVDFSKTTTFIKNTRNIPEDIIDFIGDFGTEHNLHPEEEELDEGLNLAKKIESEDDKIFNHYMSDFHPATVPAYPHTTFYVNPIDMCGFEVNLPSSPSSIPIIWANRQVYRDLRPMEKNLIEIKIAEYFTKLHHHPFTKEDVDFLEFDVPFHELNEGLNLVKKPAPPVINYDIVRQQFTSAEPEFNRYDTEIEEIEPGDQISLFVRGIGDDSRNIEIHWSTLDAYKFYVSIEGYPEDSDPDDNDVDYVTLYTTTMEIKHSENELHEELVDFVDTLINGTNLFEGLNLQKAPELPKVFLDQVVIKNEVHTTTIKVAYPVGWFEDGVYRYGKVLNISRNPSKRFHDDDQYAVVVIKPEDNPRDMKCRKIEANKLHVGISTASNDIP
jgi:hypothetical protein